MSVISRADSVDVFKFVSTGLVELCREVVEFVDSGEAGRLGLDIQGATFDHGPAYDPNGMFIVRFPRTDSTP